MTETTSAVDHRSRVGEERRQRMQLRLIESGLLVFAQKGVDASVVDDVIAEAGVSRGTFYNYFRTTAELLAAIGDTLGNELIALIDVVVKRHENPAERVGTGVRMFLRTAHSHPLFAAFVWRAGFNGASAGNLVHRYLPRDIAAGLERELFVAADVSAAMHVLVGISLSATFAISTRTMPKDYPEQTVVHLLLALGVPRKEAKRIVGMRLPALPFNEDSLLARTRGIRLGGARG
jgi:AcrR family transcriptional regulator